MYEQNSFEPVARVVQLASHIEQKRLADIAYETRRFVRIGESEETISQRIADNSKPLINIYHYGVTPEFGENSTLRKLFEF